MTTVVVGTAGHIDHGKTTLLRALTGIDADRLPEERKRGMTIDVGFAHVVLEDGTAIDFVDVPGHDRLVGNMLVGAGEIDAALLVIAADDGPRAQTLEHLELLDALGIDLGIVAITKADLVDAERIREVEGDVAALVTRTSLADAPLVVVSATTGAGLDELQTHLVQLRDAAGARRTPPPPRDSRLAVDRVFSIKGRGTVVTGTLRGGAIAPGTTLTAIPGGRAARVREVQVHNASVGEGDGGRTALNLAGEVAGLRRGIVLATAGAPVVASDLILARLEEPARLGPARGGDSGGAWPPRARTTARLHAGTDAIDATVAAPGAGWTD